MRITLRNASAALCFGLLSIACQAAGGSSVPSAARAAAAPRTLTWEELIPQGWHPMDEFKDTDVSMLDDSDPRAMAMLERLQTIYRSAPVNAALDDTLVRLPGYIVPLEENQGKISEFLLVPYYGACIHTPPPPANQIVHVMPDRPAPFASMDTVWITGRIHARKTDSSMAVSGYDMSAASVIPYVEERK